MLYENLVTEKELLDFSQNFSVVRNAYLGSQLFPARKVQYLQAEYYRAIENGTLPQAAYVHAFDTEAHISDRVPLERVEVEELLIKDKINMGERLRKTTQGMNPGTDALRNFIFDDIARQAEKVVTRVEIANMDVIQNGKFTIDENNVALEIDYGIPSENIIDSEWDSDTDILALILAWEEQARDKGAAPNTIVTTPKIALAMRQNAGIQKAISGSANSGLIPTLDQLNAFLSQYTTGGITIRTYDEAYGELGKSGSKTVMTRKKFLEEGKFIMCALANGRLGDGLWGVTPEEEAQGNPFDSMRQQQYVTVTQKSEWDPVAYWTKATGLYLPVLANPKGHIIANVSLAADSEG